ncbi:MAG: hypothetical protein LC658_02205, partial [Bacteroidales bacterium]|nr:hypothetical protein [Bacteroidales bacterium]
EQAAARTEAWMLRHISEENLYNRKIDDPVKYYKWPLALIARGKKKEARQLLDWINKNCLAENGDYVSNRSGFHKEFHTYSTLWMTLAAIELGETELIEKQLGFILQYHNKTTGGLATFPAKRENITEDPVSTAFLGWAACGLKNKELADSILPFFEKLAAQKIVDNKFWLRMAPDGSLIKAIPKNAEPKEYLINLRNEEECYYFLGAACYFLARYMETFDKTVLPLAEKYASLLEMAGEKALSTIWAAKVAPGCTALYSVTQNERFFDLARPVISAVLNGQHPEGYWIKSGNPWVTVSAEQCYWLTDIGKRLQ